MSKVNPQDLGDSAEAFRDYYHRIGDFRAAEEIDDYLFECRAKQMSGRWERSVPCQVHRTT